ncbi:MAG: hypothetical protein BWX83_00302 [Candidatus Cloacimonetes bacterium ADurb.Bin117]|nr:MAG: hypothetical protein BWX83_00302 [Candidatus Cloacimonetes bacterium ADurb.Bin117]
MGGVISHADAGTGVYLGNAVAQNLVADGNWFARREDHSGVGNAEPDHGHHMLEILVRNPMGRAVRKFGADGRLYAREGDGVRPHAEGFLQMDGVVKQAQHLEFPVVEAHQGADAEVVDTCFHGAVEAVEAPEEIALGSTRMQVPVGFLVVGFLKYLVGADAHGFHGAEALNIQRRGVDVHPANLAFRVFGVINGLHGLGDVFRRIHGMLAVNHDEAFVAGFHQGLGFLNQLFAAEGGAHAFLVRDAEAAIDAVVHAFVAHVERGKEHDAVAVDAFLQFVGAFQDKLFEFGIGDAEQGCRLFRLQPVLVQGFGYYLTDAGFRCVFPGFDQLFDFGCGDK